MLVTRPSMLTLTVERLVGSSSNGHGHGRLTLSPDSSDTGSECSSSVSPIIQSQHYTSHKISLLLEQRDERSALTERVTERVTEREGSPTGGSQTTGERSRSPIAAVDNPECQYCNTRSSPRGGPCGVETEESESVRVCEGEDEKEMKVDTGRPLMTELSPSSAAHVHDDVGGHTSGKSHIGDSEVIITSVTKGHCGDDERPPSGASGGSSIISSWSNSLNYSALATLTTKSNPLKRYAEDSANNLSSKLKFSIDNILRSDFGQGAVTTKSQQYNSNNSHNNGAENNDSRSRIVERRQRRVSARNISEDSNSSCASSRREEIVDEAKVNPEVPKGPLLWPAWVYCTRYSDRPSSGPRSRRVRKKSETSIPKSTHSESDEKRPRTAFTAEQLGKLKQEFQESRYLTEKRRQDLARDLKLHENQIKIWFQNKRAKLKKSTGERGGLAIQLMAQGLYNHSTVPMDEDEEDYLPC